MNSCATTFLMVLRQITRDLGVRSMVERQILLDKIIENLMEERLFSTTHPETIEYDKWREESSFLSDHISNVMGSRISMFMRYEELTIKCESALREDAYKQGFTDRLKLLKGILFMAS